MLDYEASKHIGEFTVDPGIPGLIMPGWIEVTIKHHATTGEITTLHVNHMVLRSEDDSILQQASEKPESFELSSKILPAPERRAMRILVQGEMLGDEDGVKYSVITAKEGKGDGDQGQSE